MRTRDIFVLGHNDSSVWVHSLTILTSLDVVNDLSDDGEMGGLEDILHVPLAMKASPKVCKTWTRREHLAKLVGEVCKNPSVAP